jgi:hypothetical protein
MDEAKLSRVNVMRKMKITPAPVATDDELIAIVMGKR